MKKEEENPPRSKLLLVHRWPLARRAKLPGEPRGIDRGFLYYRWWRNKRGHFRKFRRGALLSAALYRGPSLRAVERRKQDRRLHDALRRIFAATQRAIDRLKTSRRLWEEMVQVHDRLLDLLERWNKTRGAKRAAESIQRVRDLLGLLARAIKRARDLPEKTLWRTGDHVMRQLLEGPLPTDLKRALPGFPVGIPFRAWENEKAYSAGLKDKMHFRFQVIYMGKTKQGWGPLRFLWDTPLNEAQLDDHRGVFFYFWVVLEFDWRIAPFIDKGRLRYDVDERAAKTLTAGRRVGGSKRRRAILGVPCTLEAGPTFSGNLTVKEFYRWIHTRSEPGVHHFKSAGEVRVDTPHTVRGEMYWQNMARSWAKNNYAYLKDVTVKVVEFLAFTGDLSPTRGTGVEQENIPRRKKR